MMKRLISMLLALSMLLSTMPVPAFAEDETGAGILQGDGETNEEINEGFPEYVIVLPEETEYTFSEDERVVFLAGLEQRIVEGDTFVLYISNVPVAYIAENVTMEKGGMTVEISKAPAEVYQDVNVDTILDVEDAIVTANENEGVVYSVSEDSVLFSSSPEYELKGEGTVSVTLSNFRIQYPSNGRPTLSVDYDFKVSGDFSLELEHLEFGRLRFLGIGTFDVDFLLEATANITMTQKGTFVFFLDSDDSEPGSIIRNETQNISDEFSGEGELKIGLQMAVGVDLFVSEATILTGTAGVAGKFESTEAPNPDNNLETHLHTDISCFFFLSIGPVAADFGAEIPVYVKRNCDYGCSAPEKEVEYTFEKAAEDEKIFEVKTDELKNLMEMLPRMLCGNQTIPRYTELEKSCSVESGSRLTIAENQTLVVNGNMKQSGVVELEAGAALIVNGSYWQTGGTLTLGEGALLHVEGDYTIEAPHKPLLDGELKLEYTFGGELEVEDGEGTEVEPEEGSQHYEICLSILKNTVLKMNPGSNLIVLGTLCQDGGTIEGGSYTDKCTIQVGQEGAATGGDYILANGSLKMDTGYDILIYGNYEVSGGKVDLRDNVTESQSLLKIAKNYRNSDEADVTIHCCVTVGGNISLSETAKVRHNNHTMTIGGDFKQTGESVFNASNLTTLCFVGGRTHKVEFEAPENSNIGTIICEIPETDKLDVPNGMPAFHLGSDIEAIGDLRLVDEANHTFGTKFQGNGLTVHGDLIQDGALLGDISASGESVRLTVDGDYVIADGRLRTNGGTINIAGDFRMHGYDAATNKMISSQPSSGGFYAEDVVMTVGGSVEVFCKIEDGLNGFCFTGPIKGAKLTVNGNLIQRNGEDSDPSDQPFELGSNCELVFAGTNQPQTISFETEPQLSGYGCSPTVINRNPYGLIWGSNTEKLENLLLQYSITFDANGGSCETSSISVAGGKKIGSLPVAERDGYVFNGWYTESNGGTKITSGTIVSSDMTVYAAWGKEQADIAVPIIGVSNVASSGKPRLTWDKTEGAVQYEIYRATSENGEYSLLKATSGTSLTNTSTEAGKTYYYKVRSVGADGRKSDFSNIVSRTCDLPRPVVTVSNVASSGKPKLSWDAVEGAVKYEVYRATSRDGTYSLLKTTTGTSLTNTSTTVGTTYYYKVRALHSSSSANSAYSAMVSRTCDLPRPVVTVGNVASTGKPKLSWDAVEGAVKYEVYRATSRDGTYSLLKTTTGTSLTNTSTTAGTTYYYKVKALHSSSSANSAYSSVVSRTCDLTRPTLKVTLNSSGNPKLSWTKIDGATKYEVYRATSKDGSYTLLKTTTGTSLTNTSVTAGTTYYYKVRAVHSVSSANSAYSAIKYISAK